MDCDCKDGECECVVDIQAGSLGLSQDELRERYPGWAIDRRTSEFVSDLAVPRSDREVELVEQCRHLLEAPTARSAAHAALRRLARAYLLALGELHARRSGEYWQRTDFVRAAGDVMCGRCGLEYRQHDAPDPMCPTLARLCDGRLVKL